MIKLSDQFQLPSQALAIATEGINLGRSAHAFKTLDMESSLKGKGGTGGIKVHFTVKKKRERSSEGKDFYGPWGIFLKDKRISISGV